MSSSHSSLSVVEALESRRLMSVVPVLNTNDSGAGSLRAAILMAADGDMIDMSSLTGTITETSPIATDKGLTIVGSGESTLAIHGDGTDPVLIVGFGALTLKNLTITGGDNVASGGGIFSDGVLELDNVTVENSHAFLFGGGIYSTGTSVTLNNTTILGNTVSGALEASGGGLYMNGGTLTINGSTFAGNQAIGASNSGLTSGPGTGGGIYLKNTLASTITNSTFGNNAALGGTGGILANNGQAYGGAIYTNTSNGTLLDHVTIAYNAATGGGSTSLLTAQSQGGGVYSVGTGVVTMNNSIAALNSAMTQPDVVNSVLNTVGNDLIGICSTSSPLHAAVGNLLGTTLAPLAPGLSNTLSNNGGDTMTYSLTSTSPAINSATVDSVTLDQRGLGRRDAPDMGAFELNPNYLPVLTSTLTPTAVAGAVYTVPLTATDQNGDTVHFSATGLPDWLKLKTLNGVQTLTGAPTEVFAGTSTITLTADDGFQTVPTTFKLKVGVPSIDLSDRGLLRVNGTDSADNIHVWLLKGNKTVRVQRNKTIKNFTLASIKSIQVYGFGGDDTITVGVASRGVYAMGGDGNDSITGGDGYDILSGGDGNDTIHGGGGDDRLNGNAGNDQLFGDAGDDRLFAGKGRDFLDGGKGFNLLSGDEGNDTFDTTQGTDSILGGDGTDTTGGTTNSSDVLDSVETI